MSFLLFEVGGRRFATRAAAVGRVARRSADTVRFWYASELGAAPAAERGLVARVRDGEEALGVDRIVGLVQEARIHPLPLLAADCLQAATIAGLIEMEDELVPLVDLPAVLQARLDRHEEEREGSDGAERGAHDPRAQAPGTQAGGR